MAGIASSAIPWNIYTFIIKINQSNILMKGKSEIYFGYSFKVLLKKTISYSPTLPLLLHLICTLIFMVYFTLVGCSQVIFQITLKRSYVTHDDMVDLCLFFSKLCTAILDLTLVSFYFIVIVVSYWNLSFHSSTPYKICDLS